MIARREWTRKFWDTAGDEYTLLTSVAVLEELERGDFPSKLDATELVKSLPLLPSPDELLEIVETYIGWAAEGLATEIWRLACDLRRFRFLILA